jgi:hypothetical protein
MNKRILKNICLLALFGALTSSAYAVLPGFYMGAMFGPATNSASNTQAQTLFHTLTPVTPKSTQYGTSIYAGYKVNQYAGSEFGFTYYSGINYDTKNVPTCSGPNTRVRDLHALFKGSVPVGTGFEAFGKAGVALVYQTTGGALNPELSKDCGQSVVTNKAAPSFAIGVGYDLSQNWVLDGSLNRLLTGGAAGSMTWFALGISYHFVSTYCGQFLC